MTQPLIVDAHEDLAWNILVLGRDYTRSVEETRKLEQGTATIERNGNTLLGWPEYQRGRVAVVFATLFASPKRRVLGDWDTQSYADFDQARRLYIAQMDRYRTLADDHDDKFRLISTTSDLEDVLSHWDTDQESHPVGITILMEGAEGVRSPAELDEWWERGVRTIGLAWAGTRYCGGTREPGPLTDEGRELLAAMAEIGFTLDISHMDPLSALQALDTYPGAVIASHANAAALLAGYDGNRQLPDTVIQGLIDRGGIVGVVPFCRFLLNGWRVDNGRETISLATLANHIDHVCQLAGDARHVGLGTDFDGGFGVEHAPSDVDTIADMQNLGPVLAGRGYSDSDIAAILGGNWLEHLERTLPE